MIRTQSSRKNALRRSNFKNRRGFTLIELMIGMVVLMIGLMATMAMQTNALAGYSATRDGTAAANMGRTLEQIFKAESQSWNGIQPPANPSFFADFPEVGSEAILGNQSLLSTLHTNNWGNWLALTPQPTDNNFGTTGNRRFCSYIFGGLRTPPLDGDGNPVVNSSMLIAHIAIVYPAARGTFPDNNCPAGNTLALNPANPTSNTQLELQGLRASFFATQLYPRGL